MVMCVFVRERARERLRGKKGERVRRVHLHAMSLTVTCYRPHSGVRAEGVECLPQAGPTCGWHFKSKHIQYEPLFSPRVQIRARGVLRDPWGFGFQVPRTCAARLATRASLVSCCVLWVPGFGMWVPRRGRARRGWHRAAPRAPAPLPPSAPPCPRMIQFTTHHAYSKSESTKWPPRQAKSGM